MCPFGIASVLRLEACGKRAIELHQLLLCADVCLVSLLLIAEEPQLVPGTRPHAIGSAVCSEVLENGPPPVELSTPESNIVLAELLQLIHFLGVVRIQTDVGLGRRERLGIEAALLSGELYLALRRQQSDPPLQRSYLLLRIGASFT